MYFLEIFLTFYVAYLVTNLLACFEGSDVQRATPQE
jgi:hypothetical protein